MRWLSALLLSVMAFQSWAALFIVTRPTPVLQALVLELRGPGLFERCRQAGACARLDLAPQLKQHPRPHKMAPTDMDRG